MLRKRLALVPFILLTCSICGTQHKPATAKPRRGPTPSSFPLTSPGARNRLTSVVIDAYSLVVI